MIQRWSVVIVEFLAAFYDPEVIIAIIIIIDSHLSIS